MVAIVIKSSDTRESNNYRVVLQKIRVELEKEYLFITDYTVNHNIKLKTTRDEDYLTMVELGGFSDDMWKYTEEGWVFAIEEGESIF